MGIFDKAKEKAKDLKDNVTKDDVEQGWDTAKEQGDKYAGDNETWQNAKEKGDEMMDKYGSGDEEGQNQEDNNEENK
ncbi:hypothetical protein [Salinicoccus albus]|uniref:hypothetical protein n=1 Tax=Salinicoccus albus TaxID=418756 RepID=UPI000368DF5F|nr:hypothetical protein [Salinicoccus albus]